MSVLSIDLQLRFPGFEKTLRSEFLAGKVTGIFAKSGAGKSSLLQAIAGFNVSAGAIIFNGNCWQGNNKNHYKAAARGIGYVMQESLLFPHLSVLQNICFAAHADSHFNVAELLDALAIVDFADNPVAVLSAGQQQRVALARALMAARDLLLLDEPLSALDAPSRESILRFLSTRCKQAGLTVLYVSHSMDELAMIADDLLLLDESPVRHGEIKTLLSSVTSPLSRQDDAEAIIEARFIDFEAPCGISRVAFSAGEFQLAADLPLQPDEAMRLRIYAKDVSLCLQPPSDSSILNIFAATITAIEPVSNTKVMVYLQLASDSLLASISLKSQQQLDLQIGHAVYVQIKAVAVV